MSNSPPQVKQFLIGLIKGIIFFFGMLGLFVIIGGYSQSLFAFILTATVIVAIVGIALGLLKSFIGFIAHATKDLLKND